MTINPLSRARVPLNVLALAHITVAAGIALAALSGFHSFRIEVQVVFAATTVVIVNCGALLLVDRTGGGANGLARWRLGPWYLAWGALAYGLATYTWTKNQIGPPSIIFRESVVSACYLYSAAMAVWTIGYLVRFPEVREARRAKLMRVLMGRTAAELKSDSMSPWLLYLGGAVARVLLAVLNGGLGYLADPGASVSSAADYTQLLTALTTLATFGVALAAHQAFGQTRKGGGLPLAVMLTAEVVTGAVLGNKERFLVAALAVLIPYGMHRGKLPTKALAATATAFLLLVLPFNQAYRSVIRDGGRTLTMSESIAAVPQVFQKVLSPDSATETLSDSYDDTMSRLRLIDNVALIMQKTPDVVAFRSPTEYLYAPVIGIIPRAVWPSKPILVSGYEFSQQYYNFPPTLFTASAVTTVGDIYRHGGWVAVLVGAFLLGLLVRFLDRVFDPRLDPRAVFFVLAFFPTIVKSEIDSVELLISLPTTAFAAMIGVRLASIRLTAANKQ